MSYLSRTHTHARTLGIFIIPKGLLKSIPKGQSRNIPWGILTKTILYLLGIIIHIPLKGDIGIWIIIPEYVGDKISHAHTRTHEGGVL